MGLKNLIHEMHRRSLWQVLGIFLAASWGVVEVVDLLTEQVGLPDWTPTMAFVLLLIGLLFTGCQQKVESKPWEGRWILSHVTSPGGDEVPHVKGILQELNLPYRILRLCGGDIGFTSALTYDFEVFSTAQDRWLEISSVSNFETFQANRLKLRFKNSEGKSELAHTLNGSSLALPRVLAGLLENCQTPEGIKIPEVLVPYCGFELIN